jgi:cell division protein YceG involved in septum cleavage
MLDYVLCILIICSAIVLFCSLSYGENKFKVKINNKKEDIKIDKEISNPKLLEKLTEEKPTENSICKHVLDKDPITEHINNHIKPGLEYIQSNIFDPINYNLYYKNVLMQFNIQGLDEDISGYDKTLY